MKYKNRRNTIKIIKKFLKTATDQQLVRLLEFVVIDIPKGER